MPLPQLLYEDLKQLLAHTINQPIADFQFEAVSGGSINQSYKLTFSKGHAVFCKLNNAKAFPNLFLTERQSLEALRRTGAITTPHVLACAVLQTYQVLLLQWVAPAPKSTLFFQNLGAQLAAVHQHTALTFGWPNANYMGSVPQANETHGNWISFFTSQRLQPLVRLCEAKGLLTAKEHGLFETLYNRLPLFFDAAEKPALLHGDLWNGNCLCTGAGMPVLIDPATHYGHRVMDLALTTLFGGFEKPFYGSYANHFPLPHQYPDQVKLCNLYPLLIHLYLFGRSYLAPIRQTLLQLC